MGKVYNEAKLWGITSELGFASGSWIQVITNFMTKQSAITTNRSREAWLAGKLVACLFLFSVAWIGLDQHWYPQQGCQQCFRGSRESQKIPKNPEKKSWVSQSWLDWPGALAAGEALLLPTEAPTPQLTSHGRPWAVGSWTGVLSVGREQLRGWGRWEGCLLSPSWWPPPASTGGAPCSTGGAAAPMAREDPGEKRWEKVNDGQLEKACWLSFH